MLKAINQGFLPREVVTFHFDSQAGEQLEKLIPFTEGSEAG